MHQTIVAKGRELHRANPGKYDRTEPYFFTAVWHELQTLDTVDAVTIAEELLRRAKARLDSPGDGEAEYATAVAERREYTT